MKSLNSLFSRVPEAKVSTGVDPVSSATTTAVPSHTGSVIEPKKENASTQDEASISQIMAGQNEKTVSEIPDVPDVSSDKPENGDSNGISYLTGLPLVIVVISLCLAVLLVALVGE